jgi:hypothetical protein
LGKEGGVEGKKNTEQTTEKVQAPKNSLQNQQYVLGNARDTGTI